MATIRQAIRQELKALREKLARAEQAVETIRAEVARHESALHALDGNAPTAPAATTTTTTTTRTRKRAPRNATPYRHENAKNLVAIYERLLHRGPAVQARLAGMTGLDSGTVSRCCAILERDGFIEREDPTRKRGVRYRTGKNTADVEAHYTKNAPIYTGKNGPPPPPQVGVRSYGKPELRPETAAQATALAGQGAVDLIHRALQDNPQGLTQKEMRTLLAAHDRRSASTATHVVTALYKRGLIERAPGRYAWRLKAEHRRPVTLRPGEGIVPPSGGKGA